MKKTVFRNIAIFTVVAIFSLMLNRWLLLIIKVTLISILILKAIDSTEKSYHLLTIAVYKHLKVIFQT